MQLETPTLDEILSGITTPEMINAELVEKLKTFNVEKVPLTNMKISPLQFTELCDSCELLCEVEHLILEFNNITGIVTLSRPASVIHRDCESMFYEWCVDVADKSQEDTYFPSWEYSIYLDTGARVPDVFLIEKNASFPILVIEVGVSEPLEHLFESARTYFRESDGVTQVVILVKVHEKNRHKVEGPPWGLTKREIQIKRANKTLLEYVLGWHKKKDFAILGDLKVEIYFWSSERKNPPSGPIWVWEYGQKIPYGEGSFTSGMRNPLLDKDFRLKLFGATIPLPVERLQRRLYARLHAEERDRASQFLERYYKHVVE